MERERYGDVVARLAGAQKGRARGAPAYSVFVNRRIGRYLAAAAYQAGLSPNAVTGISALFTATGIVLLAAGPRAWWVGLVVWLLLALGYAWDSADGQVARLQGGGSVAGEWLDHFVDSAKVIALHLAVAIGLFRSTDLEAWLLLPLGFALVNGVTFFGMILNDLLKGARGLPSATQRGGYSPARSLLLLPTDYGALCAVFLLWGSTAAFLVGYGLFFVAAAAFLGLASLKWFRDMTTLGRPEQAS